MIPFKNQENRDASARRIWAKKSLQWPLSFNHSQLSFQSFQINTGATFIFYFTFRASRCFFHEARMFLHKLYPKHLQYSLRYVAHSQFLIRFFFLFQGDYVESECKCICVCAHVFVCMCGCCRDGAREQQHSLWVGGASFMMPTDHSEDELSSQVQTDPMPNSCMWHISQQAATWLWQTLRAAVSAWQTGGSPTRWFSQVKNNSNYKEKYHSRLTDACSIRIIKKNPKGRNGVKREKSVEVRKQRGFCCNRGEIGNTWKPK